MNNDPNAVAVVENCILMQSGLIDMANLTSETIEISDIASSLSKFCRFGGHCRKFYSVAEHSLHVMRVGAAAGCDIEQQKHLLMHDAAEAYIGDIIRPIKMKLDLFQQMESFVENAIFQAFDIQVFDRMSEFDNQVLKAEINTMFKTADLVSHKLDEIKTVDIDFEYLAPKGAEYEFMVAFDRLFNF